MTRITVSLPADLYAWLQAEAERAGLSMGSVLRAVLDGAQRAGWSVEPGPGAQVRTPR